MAIVLGGVLLYTQREPAFEVLPLPGEGLSVRTSARINVGDNFNLEVSTPMRGDLQDSPEVGDPVDFLISMDNGKSTVIKHVNSLSPSGLYFFGKIEFYNSAESWHLDHGKYMIEIKCIKGSPLMAARGATVTFGHPLFHATERLLQRDSLSLLGMLLVAGGLIGFIIGWRASKSLRREI